MPTLASFLELPAARDGARLIAWLKGEGEAVRRGEPVAEVDLGAHGRSEIALDTGGTLLRRLAVPGDRITAEMAVAIVADVDEAAATDAPDPAAGEDSPDDDPRAETALAVLPPRRLARAMGSAEHVDRPLSPEGQRAAARTLSAHLDTPKVCADADADATALLAYSERLSRVLGARHRLRPIDLAVKAAALALRRVPDLNATFLGDALRYYTQVHVGLAIPSGDALVAPAIRHADLKNLDALGSEARDLEARAAAGRLTREELSPAPVAVCDVGALGVDRAHGLRGAATASIALGRLRREPVAMGEKLAIGHRLRITLECDERVADGVVAARFLGEIVAAIEHPESLAL